MQGQQYAKMGKGEQRIKKYLLDIELFSPALAIVAVTFARYTLLFVT